MRIITKLIMGFLLFILILLSGQCTCFRSTPTSTVENYTVKTDNSNVTLNGASLSPGNVSGLPQYGNVTTDASGKATMNFSPPKKEVVAFVNYYAENATSLMARPDPKSSDLIFYLHYGVVHLGKVGERPVSVGVGTYANITTIDPLVRLAVTPITLDPKNPHELVQIAVYDGLVNVTIQNEEFRITSNQELTFNSQTGRPVIRTPVFTDIDKQAFSKLASDLKIKFNPISSTPPSRNSTGIIQGIGKWIDDLFHPLQPVEIVVNNNSSEILAYNVTGQPGEIAPFVSGHILQVPPLNVIVTRNSQGIFISSQNLDLAQFNVANETTVIFDGNEIKVGYPKTIYLGEKPRHILQINGK